MQAHQHCCGVPNHRVQTRLLGCEVTFLSQRREGRIAIAVQEVGASISLTQVSQPLRKRRPRSH
ncbi:hypothetical protein SacazDRAFT_04239 [Saccharomonospora azurea NA-128]|uniref:Uncharacterized protein n=1 Tax=Saccharomonospora azurea NA-128 TaxID=882081 RepID=H8GFQ2_9PSEU|nr:hypothetical protein SacazDRAFT_04239 [Saccharomonospora azurea NA-128]